MLKKIKHLFQRLIVCCKEFPKDNKEFGWKVAWIKFRDVLIPTGKSKKYIETLSDYMVRELAPLTEQYCHGEFTSRKKKANLDKTPIWVCWWQGEENAPPVVRACLRRMRDIMPDSAQLHVITWDNLNDYVELPDYIFEKFNQGLITNIHMTDILRYALVSTYGGAWIDSTVWLSNQIEDKLPEYLSQQYFTQRFESWEDCPKEACRGKWCNFFFMGQSTNPLFAYAYDALLLWWQEHNRLIDYVIVDYVLWAGYCGVPEIRQCIDAVEPNNPDIWLMEKHLNNPFVQEEYALLMASNDFFKLSYKGKLMMQTEDGEKTVYGHILLENEE